MFRKISVVTVSLLMLVVCFTLAFLSKKPAAKAQETKTHNIRIEDYPLAYQKKEPVKIIGLYLGTDPLESGKDFQANKDWVRNLGFRIKNVSDQSIREVILDLELPTHEGVKDWIRNLGIRIKNVSDQPIREVILNLDLPNSTRTIERIEIRYGRDYWYLREPDKRIPEILLRPGETTIVSYDFNFKDSPDLLRSFLSLLNRPLPNRGYVALETVVFEDTDKGWSRRNYMMRNGTGWIGDPEKAHLNGRGRNQGQTSQN